MEIAGTFFQEVIALVGYALVFAAVYKLFQISSDLGEIKELLKRRSSPLPATSPILGSPRSASTPAASLELSGAEGESATAYAEQLMRALHSQNAQQPGEQNWSETGKREIL